MFDPLRDALEKSPFLRLLDSRVWDNHGNLGTTWCWTEKALRKQEPHGGLCYRIQQQATWWYCHECVGEYLVKIGFIW
jgi:hypothetical protein